MGVELSIGPLSGLCALVTCGVLLGPPSPACAGTAGERDDSHVIATVDGLALTVVDFERACAARPRNEGEDPDAYRDEIVEDMVGEAALYLEALRQEIDRDPAIRKMMINTLLRQQLYSTLPRIAEEELVAYWEAHRGEFVVPEKVQIKRILIRVREHRGADEARALAEELRARAVADPGAFKDLASAHSDGPYQRRGGDIGFVGRGGKEGVEPEVVAAAFELETGAISEVLEIGDGFHVLYLANRRERAERTFEQMRGSVLRDVKSIQLNAMFDEYRAGLVEEAEVVIDAGAVEALSVEDLDGR
jgi:peptidylprolyl isomerase